MRQTPKTWAVLLGAVLALVAACELLGNSRVRDGQLYRTGESAYDTYFHDVHDLQVAAADLDLDRRAARRPVIDALQLTPDSADATIVQVAHEQLAAAAPQIGAAKLEIDGEEARVRTQSGTRGNPETEKLLLAIEASVKAEIARGKKLRDIQPKIEAVLKAGHELEPHVKDDFAKHDSRGQKPFEVRNELSSSYDVLSVINYRARREARAAESYVADLQRAVAIGGSRDSTDPSAWPAMPAPSSSASAPDAGTTGGAPTPHASASAPPPHAAPPRHAPSPAPQPPAPAPAPPPKPTSTGEVFNP